MGILKLAFGAELRHRWRSWLAVALLVTVVGGVTLAAAGAARRTSAAVPGFFAVHGFDEAVYTFGPTPQIAHSPEAAAVDTIFGPDNGYPQCACTHPINPNQFGLVYLQSQKFPLYTLVSGRLPDTNRPDEVLASYTFQADLGLHLGGVVHVPLYSAAQDSEYNSATGAFPTPHGPTVALRVVGFEASEIDLPNGAAPTYNLYVTRAFGRTVLPRIATGYAYLVRLRPGASRAAFESRVGGLGQPANDQAGISGVEAAVHPQAVGWWILALLAALVGCAVVGQAIGRQALADSEDYTTLSTLGMDRSQLIALGTARNLAIGVAGALGSVALAWALSPVAPLGEARVAASSGGLHFDPVVASIGLAAVAVGVGLLGMWPVVKLARLRSSRPGPLARPSTTAMRLATMGASPSAVIGVRNALERGGDRASVPTTMAMLGTALAVVGLCATAVFGASLTHLVNTPRLFGVGYQMNFTNPNEGPPDPTLVAQLENDPAVRAITEGHALEVALNSKPVALIAGQSLRGSMLLSAVSGHVPDGPGQIGLGAVTLRQLNTGVGSTVNLSLRTPDGIREAKEKVVSEISFPNLGGVVSLGNGAAMTVGGLEDVECGSQASAVPSACTRGIFSGMVQGGLLVSVAGGRSGQQAVTRYLNDYRAIASLPFTPTSLVNFGQAVNFPLLFGAMLAIFGAATLIHLLVVSVSRRRREVGLLKSIGFVRSQVAAAVTWQATTLAVIGTVIGVPVGIVVGKETWSAFANNLGFVPVTVVPVALTAIVVAGVLVVANLIALAPAVAATTSRPADLMRTG